MIRGSINAAIALLICATSAFAQSGGPTSSPYSLPTATSSVLGGVKPDGTTIGNAAGVISSVGLTNLTAHAVDLHTATGDVATIAIPGWVTAYQVTAFKITNCSATPVLASLGLFTAASGGGTIVVTSATITGATSASVVLSATIASTARLTAGTLYINLSVANALALTCDLHVDIDNLS